MAEDPFLQKLQARKRLYWVTAAAWCLLFTTFVVTVFIVRPYLTERGIWSPYLGLPCAIATVLTLIPSIMLEHSDCPSCGKLFRGTRWSFSPWSTLRTRCASCGFFM